MGAWRSAVAVATWRLSRLRLWRSRHPSSPRRFVSLFLIGFLLESCSLIGFLLESCNLIGFLLERCNLIGFLLESCNLIGYLLESCNLIGYLLESCNLIGYLLERCNLNKFWAKPGIKLCSLNSSLNCEHCNTLHMPHICNIVFTDQGCPYLFTVFIVVTIWIL